MEEFNRGLFFECHDTLEDLWSGIRGPARDFFQGLIQVAVAFHHVSNGNAPGARQHDRRALGRFRAYPGRYFGFDLDAQRAELGAWRERLAQPGWEERSAASAVALGLQLRRALVEPRSTGRPLATQARGPAHHVDEVRGPARPRAGSRPRWSGSRPRR